MEELEGVQGDDDGGMIGDGTKVPIKHKRLRRVLSRRSSDDSGVPWGELVDRFYLEIVL